MKYYILCFIAVMCISCALAGTRNSKAYVEAGVSDVMVEDHLTLSAQKHDSLVGEMILVDGHKPHRGGASVKDMKT